MIYFVIVQAINTGEILLMEGASSYSEACELAENGLVNGNMVQIAVLDGLTGKVATVEEF